MSDPILVLCLILLLWLVVRDLSRETFRPEPPLLPQHQNNVRYTVEQQQSVSERQHQEEALPPKARCVQSEHEQAASAKPLQAVPLSVPSASQERNETPLRALPQQINEPGQSPILAPQLFVSPTNSTTAVAPQLGSVQVHQAASTPPVPDVSGLLQLLQDDLDEESDDYAKFRELAKGEEKAIQKYQMEKKQAKANGQPKKLVKQLTKEIKKHRQRRQLFDEKASSLIFAKNNKNRRPDRVDLHGLTADEARTHAKRAISDARKQGVTEIHFIVGKGLHSSGPPVLKPSMLSLVKKLKLSAEVHPSNEGVLVVQLAPKVAPLVVSEERDQTLVQPTSPQTSRVEQSPVLSPEVHLSSAESDQQMNDVSQSPVGICQVAAAPNANEGVPLLSQGTINTGTENEGNNFVMIRQRAKEERKMMLNFRKEKKLAQAMGQMALAKELAEKESEHEKRSTSLNAEASELIFAEHNKDGPSDTVVLLDLKSKEAKKFAKRTIKVAREQRMKELRMVVGDGPYSEDGPYQIKPVLSRFLKKKRKIPFKVDPTNNGILVVTIGPECDNI